MSKKLVPLFALLLLLGSDLSAQWDRFGANLGFVYEFINIKERLNANPVAEVIPFYGMSLGFNYVIAHTNDVASFSANSGARVAFSFISGAGSRFLIQVPFVFMGRVGAGSTNFNEQKIGAGLGVGANFTYFRLPQFGSGSFKQAFTTPNAVGELSIKNGPSVYHIRFHWSLTGASHENAGLDLDYKNLGLEVVYTF